LRTDAAKAKAGTTQPSSTKRLVVGDRASEAVCALNIVAPALQGRYGNRLSCQLEGSSNPRVGNTSSNPNRVATLPAVLRMMDEAERHGEHSDQGEVFGDSDGGPYRAVC
jgi:hypothetical protein